MHDAEPRHHTVTLQQISEALITSGYTSLDAQAKALGIHRSTAWTIIKARHKLGRLSSKTTSRILANPEAPPAVRTVIEKYLAEKSQCNQIDSMGQAKVPRCSAEMEPG
jgi:hypothetical protein